MSINYDIGDLINNLIDLEKSGEEFYTTLAARTDDLAVKHLFSMLADQEKTHQKIYEGLLVKADVEIEIDEEYHAYLQVILEEQFGLDPDLVAACDSVEDALELAIKLEKDSLLFLSEFGTLIGAQGAEMVEEMKRQERNHLKLITEMKQKLT